MITALRAGINQLREFLRPYQVGTLLKTGTWYLAATGFTKVLGFASIFLFTRIMSTEEYGTSSIYLTSLAILTSTITLGVQNAVSRAYYDYDEKEYPAFVSAVLFLGMISSLLFTGLFMLLPALWIERAVGISGAYLLLGGFTAACSLAIDSSVVYWQVSYRAGTHSIITSVLVLLRILLSVALILAMLAPFGGDAGMARIVAISAVNIVAGLILAGRWFWQGRSLIRPDYWGYAVRFAGPLIPHQIAGVALAQFDRLLVDQFVGRSETGLYTLAYQVGEVVSLLWLATNTAWQPWFFEHYKQGDRARIRQISVYYVLGFGAVCVAMLLIIAPMRLLLPPEYFASIPVIPVVMAGQFWNLPYALFSGLTFYKKENGKVAAISIFAALVNVGLNVLLIPRFGYIAAAWTTLISYALMALSHLLLVRFVYKEQELFNSLLLLGSSVLYTLIALGLFFAIN